MSAVARPPVVATGISQALAMWHRDALLDALEQRVEVLLLGQVADTTSTSDRQQLVGNTTQARGNTAPATLGKRD